MLLYGGSFSSATATLKCHPPLLNLGWSFSSASFPRLLPCCQVDALQILQTPATFLSRFSSLSLLMSQQMAPPSTYFPNKWEIIFLSAFYLSIFLVSCSPSPVRHQAWLTGLQTLLGICELSFTAASLLLILSASLWIIVWDFRTATATLESVTPIVNCLKYKPRDVDCPD